MQLSDDLCSAEKPQEDDFQLRCLNNVIIAGVFYYGYPKNAEYCAEREQQISARPLKMIGSEPSNAQVIDQPKCQITGRVIFGHIHLDNDD